MESHWRQKKKKKEIEELYNTFIIEYTSFYLTNLEMQLYFMLKFSIKIRNFILEV